MIELQFVSGQHSAVFFHAPFRHLDRSTAWLRMTLLGASFLGMVASAPLWINSHAFPLLPIAPWFPILPAPWDKGLFALMLLALVAALWCYRPAVGFFLIAGLFSFFEDQNRGQPWFYMYWVMLILSLFPEPSPELQATFAKRFAGVRANPALAACRCAISVAYIWSGIQKFNSRFFTVTPAWFIAPAARWHLPAGLIEMLRWSVMCAPVLEVGIGLALWVPRLRLAAIFSVAALHLMALLFLGPLGYNYNWVVWPWNLAMVTLVWSLFGADKFWRKRQTSVVSEKTAKAKHSKPRLFLEQTFAELKHSKFAMLVLGLFSFLPILSYRGWWDSYFSFSLYSENAAVANVFISKEFGDRLPPNMRPYVQQFPQAFDPQHQGPYVFGFQAWGYEELHVPPISEPRNFRSVFHFLRSYSREPNDLRMIVGQRWGPVIFYEGERYEFLMPK